MKAIKILVLCTCVTLLFFSCEDDSATTPKAEITVSGTQFSINESMTIYFTGIADQVSIYTGDDSHDYELRSGTSNSESNTGFVVNKDLFTYSYSTPGVYKVVCVASTYTDKAIDLKQDTCSFWVTVIDDKTEIQNLSCSQVLYDEVFADKLENDEWLMKLPRKVKYNTSTPSISLSQKLSFYIESDSTKVFINDEEYSSSTKYDLSEPLDILVRSNYGTTRPYTLYTIYYSEFGTFNLSGVKGTFVRNAYDYSTFEMQITLPAGTDVSGLIPEFTTSSSTDKVYIGDIEQVSGVSEVDFSQTVTYTIVAAMDEYPNMQATSTVSVTISYE